MSKVSSASAQKLPSQPPVKSAWAKGPPTTSPRSQSPAPIYSHSRRPSNLGQGIPVKDGVSVPKNSVAAVKHGSAVTFGSINDAESVASSSAPPASIKPEGVKSFGSVPADTPTNHNGKSSPALPTKPNLDVRKLFQNPGQSASSSAQTPTDAASPSVRLSNLPPQPPPSQQPGPPPHSSFSTFVPGSSRQPQQNAGSANGQTQTPRSPVYSRQMLNGAGGGPRPPNGPSGPPISTGLSSPRLGHPMPGQPGGMQPQPPVAWGYYYPGSEQYMQPYQPVWYPQPGAMPPHQHPHQHQHQHHPPPGPQGQHQHHGPMTMSPRNPHPPLQVPGTPTQVHAVANPHPHPPHHGHAPSASLSSPPPTPSSSTQPIPGTPGGARLNTSAAAFVPRPASKVTIKSQDGTEVDLQNLTKPSSVAAPSPPVSSPGKKSVRMESEAAKNQRLAEEQEKARRVERTRKEAEDKEREERARRENLEKERIRKEEEEERIQKELEEKEKEKERIRKEEEKERLRKEEEKRLRLEEEERKKEEERQKEEEERQKEEEEREKEREKERIRKEEEEREAQQKKDEAEKERLRLQEEEKAKAAAAAEAEAEAKAAEKAEVADEVEEGEVAEVDSKSSIQAPDTRPEVKEKPKEVLRIDTTTTPLPKLGKQRPGPLDISSAQKSNIPAALPSALATARIIDDLGRVPYPEGIKSPQVELNIDAKDGKFRYDRDFLLQFMAICKEKPDVYTPLDALGIEADQASYPMSRGGSGRHRQSSQSMAPPALARQNSIGLGISGGGFAKSAALFSMGNFSTPGSGKTSEERFAMASGATRSASVGGAAGLPFTRPPQMVRTASQGGPGGAPMGNNRTRSKRGEKRNDGNKINVGQQSHSSAFSTLSSGMLGSGLEPVAPLEMSVNRWVPVSGSKKPVAMDPDSPELVDRKVKGLLNKLTMEKFDSISDQIITWANKSEKEKDGRTLIQVIRLVFEKATDEAAWSEMYARLCRKMMERISSAVQDDGIKNAEGKPITGGQLFRKYLLNRCQEDFERGWGAKETTAAAAATKASEDQAVKALNEKKEGETGDAGEAILYSDEYYAAQKAKRQGLGLIKFIGELFKLQMLTERIMHECVKKLLSNVDNPEEEEIESLCKLLTTVGAILDTAKAHAHMDVYFTRMKELTKSPNVSSRMQYMLQDVIELRERKWVARNLVAAPTTIAQIHEAAAKEKAQQDKESYQRQMSMSRGGSRRGNERGDFPNPDGWAVAGGSGPPRAPPKAGDLSQFGKINKAAPMTFGPSSVFAGKKDSKARDSISRTNSSQNMYSLLGNSDIPVDSAPSKGSRPPSRKPSVDMGHGVPEPLPQRRKLQLLPRSRPQATEEAAPNASEGPSEDDTPTEATMSEADVKKKIDEDLKEFFAVRNLDEAEVYFTTLPGEQQFRLVDKLVATAIESKEADAQLVGDLFARAVSKDLCSGTAFEEGFFPIAELLDDIAIDAPKAFNLMAMMMNGAGLDEERRTRIAGKSMDSDKLLALLS